LLRHFGIELEVPQSVHHKNFINNSHIAAWFFNKRFEIFFNDMLKQKWDLKD